MYLVSDTQYGCRFVLLLILIMTIQSSPPSPSACEELIKSGHYSGGWSQVSCPGATDCWSEWPQVLLPGLELLTEGIV